LTLQPPTATEGILDTCVNAVVVAKNMPALLPIHQPP
jgi:hypothetical protein